MTARESEPGKSIGKMPAGLTRDDRGWILRFLFPRPRQSAWGDTERKLVAVAIDATESKGRALS